MPAKKTKSKPKTRSSGTIAVAIKPTASPLTWALAITFSVLTVVFVGQVLYYYT